LAKNAKYSTLEGETPSFSRGVSIFLSLI